MLLREPQGFARKLKWAAAGPGGPGTPWAELLRRVFEVDVLECPRCRGRMRVLAAIVTPEAIRAILDCLGLPPRAPPVSPAERNDSAVCTFEI